MSEQSPTFANSNICNNCECVLSFWRGKSRHHCRACGNTFCADCSYKTSIIPRYNIDKEVRVCNTCYEQLQISHEEPVRQSMFELNDEEALHLAVAISQSEVDSRVGRKPSNTRFVVNRSNSRSKTQCPICFEERLEWALKNCGHVVCGECLSSIEKCPICRNKVSGAIRIYINN